MVSYKTIVDNGCHTASCVSYSYGINLFLFTTWLAGSKHYKFVLYFFRKPVTHRTKRILKNKEPKLIENVKQTLFIRGRKTHDVVLNCMKDMVNICCHCFISYNFITCVISYTI